MSEPIVFVSHFRVKEGKLEGMKQLFPQAAKRLEADKPRTLLFLSYLNQNGTRVSIIHAFADAEAMDLHVQGSDERGRAGYEYVAPAGWEIYGRPSPPALDMMRREATSAGVTLTVEPDHLAGFLRLTSTADPGHRPTQ